MRKTPEWVIAAGACVFVFMLALSAAWEPDIRWLHFFQAWMYLATMLLAFRGNVWAYFIGISAAGFWIYANIFATTFFFNGIEQLVHWMRTGRLDRPDLLIAVPAWFSNLAVVVGCLWAYLRGRRAAAADAARFVAAFALTTGFFALDMAVFQPRYLGLFPRLLHPQWHSLRF